MINVNGFSFIEFSTESKPNSKQLRALFDAMGFKHVGYLSGGVIDVYEQGNIRFLINDYTHSATVFSINHGPSVCSFGFQVKNPEKSHKKLLKTEIINTTLDHELPSIKGIGGCRLFLTKKLVRSKYKGCGLKLIDHITHNVYQGNMNKWADFYKKYFGFEEIRYFDIKGKQTGLISRAMGNGTIAIPINEASDNKSQIAEYLEKYRGEGVQHIALLTDDIYNSVELLRANGVEFMNVPNTYYDEIDTRIPGHNEDLERMKKNKILIDGSKDNILLQIFTKTYVGPIFFEIIQRKGNKEFGDGNFQALFEAIERDQIKRGVL